MNPRFRNKGGATDFQGVGGQSKADSKDGIRRKHPSSDDGTLSETGQFLDLETGERYYWDGDTWKLAVTVHERILAELVAQRVQTKEQNQRQIELLESIQEALWKLA